MLLFAAIGALCCGPLLFVWGGLSPRTGAFLDGFAFITVAGLFMFGILPEAIQAGGMATWGFVTLGLAFPLTVEHFFHGAAHRAHRVFLGLGLLGLVVHCLVDGLILLGVEPLGPGALGASQELALAVVLHNLPKGIALWCLLVPVFGPVLAGGVLAALAGGTALGYLYGESALTLLSGPGLGWFQAFVAGSILHVVVHGMAAHESPAPNLLLPKWPERLGLLLGLGLLFAYL